MTKDTFLAFSFLLLFSCKGEIEFKRVGSSSRNEAPKHREIFLVGNVPNNPVLRDSLLVEFAKKTMPDFCSLSVDVTSYSIYFYESTRCTRSFDEHDMGEYSSLAMDDEGCPEDKLPISFYYKRSETNPKNWYLYLPRTDADTIYCE